MLSTYIVRAIATGEIALVAGALEELRIAHRPHHVRDRLGERPKRRHRARSGIDVAGVGEKGEDHQPAVLLGGRNGIGGAGMTLAIAESSSGAASASAMKP